MSDPGAEWDRLSIRADKHRGGLPREKSSRANEAAPRRPALWNGLDVLELPAPCYGAFPRGFAEWAVRQLGARPAEVLHLCSGMLSADEVGGGLRVDIRTSQRPDVVADARALPFADGTVGAVLLDPPYCVEYAEDLYGVEYPRPAHLLAEASRVVKPCGRIGFLHYLVPRPPDDCRIVSIRGIVQGCGYRIRAFTVLERYQEALW